MLKSLSDAEVDDSALFAGLRPRIEPVIEAQKADRAPHPEPDPHPVPQASEPHDPQRRIHRAQLIQKISSRRSNLGLFNNSRAFTFCKSHLP